MVHARRIQFVFATVIPLSPVIKTKNGGKSLVCLFAPKRNLQMATSVMLTVDSNATTAILLSAIARACPTIANVSATVLMDSSFAMPIPVLSLALWKSQMMATPVNPSSTTPVLMESCVVLETRMRHACQRRHVHVKILPFSATKLSLKAVFCALPSVLISRLTPSIHAILTVDSNVPTATQWSVMRLDGRSKMKNNAIVMTVILFARPTSAQLDVQ